MAFKRSGVRFPSAPPIKNKGYLLRVSFIFLFIRKEQGNQPPFRGSSRFVRLAFYARQLRIGQASCNSRFYCLSASCGITTATAFGKKCLLNTFYPASPLSSTNKKRVPVKGILYFFVYQKRTGESTPFQGFVSLIY